MLMIFILVMKDMTYKCSHFSEFSSISAVTGDAMLLFGIYHRYTNFIRTLSAGISKLLLHILKHNICPSYCQLHVSIA